MSDIYLSKVKIKNFKKFKDPFTLILNQGVNILVGENEEGKSTILEAIHLALTGILNGKYLWNELSEYLFNKDVVNEYLANLSQRRNVEPPEILIEVYFAGSSASVYEGDDNTEHKGNTGLYLKIALDERERGIYLDYIKSDVVSALPIEYYEVTWSSFSRDSITPKHIPVKSVLIDSSSARNPNGSDLYIAHIIKNHLEDRHKNMLAQAHRRLQHSFLNEKSVQTVNEIIKNMSNKAVKDRELSLSVDLSTKNVWENGMTSYVQGVPFHHIGKGHQAIIKTKLSLARKKAQKANFILLEEPENHLSHTRLNELVTDINDSLSEGGKQILISTHSSFVANKLGLDKLILLNSCKQTRLEELTPDTISFFRKISGYDTLRLILCRSAILCEGDSDELIIQKAYRIKYGKLPIEDGVEVMAVGLSFDRYIEIAERLSKRVAVVTDNDGKSNFLIKKFKDYYFTGKTVQAFFDIDDDCRTLEPQLIKANGWQRVNQILDLRKKATKDQELGDYRFGNETELLEYMLSNKTDCALLFFDTSKALKIPEYINNAITHAKGE
ncbi:ATP-dependent endonuclease [Dyadobacter sp. CY351]|uniref:ATP-dependent nuclease n=1 Tax=Dyadobacter sp. CY351 TaxID=2909337 RepID=UPI001F46CE64|nr:AAA family ATPase [Dyadobacter sp. CY351]MCF2519136.1 AAA family ATPase [Dyadobacter sp. CY351]